MRPRQYSTAETLRRPKSTARHRVPQRNTAQPGRNQKTKPTTLRRTSVPATALRHGEKPEKTSCTAEARRRGEEFNFDDFDEKFARKSTISKSLHYQCKDPPQPR